jgi:hypothetical protein
VNIRTIVAEAPDGQQVLVVIYGDPESQIHVALRPEPGDLWGPPLEVKVDEWTEGGSHG